MTMNTNVFCCDLILHSSVLIAVCRKDFLLPVRTLRFKNPVNQSFCRVGLGVKGWGGYCVFFLTLQQNFKTY